MEDMKMRLEDLVYSEAAMLELLGIQKRTLDYLRLEKGFPFVRLALTCRVYRAADVMAWIDKRAAAA